MLTDLKCYICETCGKFHVENVNIKRKPKNYRKDGSVFHTYDVFKYCSPKCSNQFVIKKDQVKISHTSQYERMKTKEYKKYIYDKQVERYGSYGNRSKAKYTCLIKYGVDNCWKSKEIRNKIKETNLKIYNTENPISSELVKNKIREVFKNKYGKNWGFESEEVKNKIKLTKLQRYKNGNYDIEKFRNSISKYWNNLTPSEYISRCKSFSKSQIGVWDSFNLEYKKSIIEKRYLTKKKNNSFNTSKPEKDFYKILLNYFGENDIFREYRCDRYPFNCDFYIKSKDLFIELNLFWTHGYRSFNRHNLDCKKLFKKWRIKQRENYNSMYTIALWNWVKTDVIKKRTAELNGLNYISIYNDRDWKEFFINLV